MRWHEMSGDAVVETLQTSTPGPTVGEARRRRSRDMFVNRARPSRTAASTSITIGIDVGAVSVKVAAAGDRRPAELNRKHDHQHGAKPKVGQRKAEQ